MSDAKEAKLRRKVVLLGNSGVGKTQFMDAILDKPTCELKAMPKRELSTIGVDFRIVTRVARDGTAVKLSIWDTAGQERFASMAPNYTRESDAIVLLYDVTDQKSFDQLESRWRPLIDDHLDNVGRANVVVYLVANKIDLEQQRVVTQGEGRAYANGRQMIYAETTALRRMTVHSVINDVVSKLAQMHASGQQRDTRQTNNTTVVVNNNSSARRCCA